MVSYARTLARVRAADLQAQTAFDLAIPPSVPSTEPPTAEELHALRTRIDLTGVLRGRS